MIADIDKRKIRTVVTKTCDDVKIRKQFKKNVIELVDDGVPNFWRHYKDWVLQACHEVCGRKKGRRIKGDTW